jgi:hypothetical protein
VSGWIIIVTVFNADAERIEVHVQLGRFSARDKKSDLSTAIRVLVLQLPVKEVPCLVVNVIVYNSRRSKNATRWSSDSLCGTERKHSARYTQYAKNVESCCRKCGKCAFLLGFTRVSRIWAEPDGALGGDRQDAG